MMNFCRTSVIGLFTIFVFGMNFLAYAEEDEFEEFEEFEEPEEPTTTTLQRYTLISGSPISSGDFNETGDDSTNHNTIMHYGSCYLGGYKADGGAGDATVAERSSEITGDVAELSTSYKDYFIFNLGAVLHNFRTILADGGDAEFRIINPANLDDPRTAMIINYRILGRIDNTGLQPSSSVLSLFGAGKTYYRFQTGGKLSGTDEHKIEFEDPYAYSDKPTISAQGDKEYKNADRKTYLSIYHEEELWLGGHESASSNILTSDNAGKNVVLCTYNASEADYSSTPLGKGIGEASISSLADLPIKLINPGSSSAITIRANLATYRGTGVGDEGNFMPKDLDISGNFNFTGDQSKFSPPTDNPDEDHNRTVRIFGCGDGLATKSIVKFLGENSFFPCSVEIENAEVTLVRGMYPSAKQSQCVRLVR